MIPINADTAGHYLAYHYGAIKEEINHLSGQNNFPGIFQAIINHLNNLLAKGQIDKISMHVKLIGWLYKRGNEYVQYIIENVFVRSFKGMQQRCTAAEWLFMYQKIPGNLKQLYISQNKVSLIKKFNL